jgi:hypothetical protein
VCPVFCLLHYCSVPYCTVLYCTVLYCTVLYCTVATESSRALRSAIAISLSDMYHMSLLPYIFPSPIPLPSLDVNYTTLHHTILCLTSPHCISPHLTSQCHSVPYRTPHVQDLMRESSLGIGSGDKSDTLKREVLHLQR